MNCIMPGRFQWRIRLLALISLACFGLNGWSQTPKPAAAPPASRPGVDVRIETTLPTWSTNRAAFALDGDPNTYFQSRREPDEFDRFTVYFSPPVLLKGFEVRTGDDAGVCRLAAGMVETSPDGRRFKQAGGFVEGMAAAEFPAQQVKALRIRPTARQEDWLVIREITLKPPVSLSRVTQPVSITVDSAQAPDLTDWGRQARDLCAAWYPRLLKLLPSKGFEPPLAVRIFVVDRINGASGVTVDSDIRLSAERIRTRPGDFGVVIHEMTHVMQGYAATLALHPGPRPPVWLQEGIAEYIRLYHFESNPPPHWIDPQSASYRDSYQTSAIFLSWIEQAHTRDFVRKINAAIREGQYDDALFKKFTGKTLDALWEEFRAILPGRP